MLQTPAIPKHTSSNILAKIIQMAYPTGLAVWLIGLSVINLEAEQRQPSPSHEVVSIVQSRQINENSGIAFSYRYPNAVWTHNDSGGKPYLFLVSTLDGQTMARVELCDAINRDWEDMASFALDGKYYLVVADVGDNSKRRDDYQLCILEEPALDLGDSTEKIIEIDQSKHQWIDLRFRYPNRSRNCEAIGVDPANRRFVLTEKVYRTRSGPTGVFELPILLENRTNLVAKPMAEVAIKNVSAMDISRDGRRMVIRAYHRGYFLFREPDESWETILQRPLPDWVELPMHPQGEGVCYYVNGQSVLLSSEKKRQPLYKVRVPQPNRSVLVGN